jgi:hypothetical protein
MGDSSEQGPIPNHQGRDEGSLEPGRVLPWKESGGQGAAATPAQSGANQNEPQSSLQDPYAVLQAIYSSEHGSVATSTENGAGRQASAPGIEDGYPILKALYLSHRDEDGSRSASEPGTPEREPSVQPPEPVPPEAADPAVKAAPPAGEDDPETLADVDPAPQVEAVSNRALNPTHIYIAAAVGFGILLGVIFAASSWFENRANGPYDLGQVSSAAVGLQGQLYTKWDEKLEYRLTLEPIDSPRHAQFALAVTHPARPLSIVIQLKDALGFVTCGREILVKFDARNAAALNLPIPGAQPGSASASPAAADFDRLAAQELDRQKGKDIFQNEIGPDGLASSISAQGELPCTRKAYDSTVAWSFSLNFPLIDEQDDWFRRQTQPQASVARQTAAARRRARPTNEEEQSAFYVEGDEVMAGFDASAGTIETNGGKTFLIDKPAGQALAPGWQVYPANLHYRCDQSDICTLTRGNSAGVLHARLKR